MKDLLLALNAAAEITRQADNTEATILQAVGEQLTRLNLRGGLALLTASGDQFAIRLAALPGSMLPKLERLGGLPAVGYTFPTTQVEAYQLALTTHQTIFVPNGSAVHEQLLPAGVRGLAGPILRILGRDPSVVAPLVAAGQRLGVLHVSGAGLTVDDVPVLTALANHIAIALANARLYQAARQRLHRLKALNTIAMALNRASGLDEALSTTLTETLAAFGLSTGWIWLNDAPDTAHFRLVAHAGLPPALAADGCAAMCEGTCECQRQLLAGQLAQATNTVGCDRLRPLGPGGPGAASHASVPLQAGDQPLGLLNLAGRPADAAFDDDDLAALMTIGQQLAAAIGRLRAQSAMADSLAREQRLNLLTRTLSSTLDLPATLQNTVRLAAELVGADAGALALRVPEGQTMTYPYLHNLPEALSLAAAPRGRGLAWQVADSGQSVLLPEYGAHPGALPAWVAAGVHSFLGVPVVAGETVIGTLGLFGLNPAHQFTRRERTLAESVGRQAGLAIQNARLFEAVRESEARHRAITELISDYAYAYRLEPDGRVVTEWLSDAFTSLTGYTVSDLAAQGDWSQLIDPQDRPAAAQRLQTLLAGQSTVGEYRLVAKDGATRCVREYSRPVWDEAHGRVIRIYGAAQDITAQRQAEEVSKKYQLLAAHTADIILFVRYRDGRLLEANEAAVQAYGRARDELLSLTVRDLRAPESQAAIQDQFDQAEREGLTFETVHRRRDGRTFPVEVSSRGALLDGERVLLSIVRDISERKRTEAAIANLARFPSETPYPVLRVDLQGVITYANPAGTALLRLWDSAPGDPAPEPWRALAAQAQANQAGQTVEVERERQTFEVVAAPVVEAGYVTFYISDITERKRAQAAVRQSEELLQAAVRVASLGVFEHDQQTDTIYWSPRQRDIHGAAPDEPINLPAFLSLIHPADRERVEASVRRAHDPAGDGRWDVEHRIVRRDGTLRWVAAKSQTFFEGDGAARHPVRTVGATLDITERKQAEEALRLTQFSVDHASVGIIRTGRAASILSVNDQMCRLLGYTADELTRLHIYDVDPGFPIERWQTHRQHLARAGSDTFETIHRRKDGATLPVQVTNSYIEFEGEEYSIAFVQDITERKRAEQALRESERQLSALVASLDDIIFELDEQGTYLHIWAANESLLVRPAADMLGQTLADVLGVDAARPFLDAIQRALDSGRSEELEYPLPVMGGQRWFLARLSPIRSDRGSRPSVSMFTRDVTRRKQAEAALADSEQKFRGFVEQSLAGFTLVDEQGLIIEWNRAQEQMTGWSRERVIGQPYWDVQRDLLPPEEWSPERHARDRQAILDALRTGQAPFFDRSLEGHILKPDGTHHTMQQVVFPIHTDRGFRLGSVSHDVTEPLQRERELESIAVVSTALRAAPTRAEMLPIILDQLLDLLNAEGTALDLYDPVSREVVIEVARGAWAPVAGQHIPPGQAVLEQVIRTGQPYISTAAASDPHFVFKDLLSGVRAMACVPLIVEGQAFGGLWVGRQMPFRTDEIRLLTALADMAASAIHRANLHEQTERRLHQLTALRAVDAAINSSMGLSITLNVVLDQVMTQLQTDAAAILLLNAEATHLDYAAGRGFIDAAAGHPSLPMGPSYASRAVLERRLISRPNLAAEPQDREAGTPLLPAGEGFQAYYGVPLNSKGQVTGVLEVFQRTPLHPDPNWLEFLETLAGQAAIAIDNARLVDSLQRSNYELIQAYDATIEGWTRALDLRDRETEGHSQRVTALTLELAVAMGMRAQQLEHVRRGGLLHDIGKMGIPDSILLKPGPLTSDEWVAMRLHPIFAYNMLKPIAYLGLALDIPYCHHEKWDGTGYPRGLKGEAIPLAARIFAVVDVWDALRSDRPYRPAWPADKVRDHIRSLAGTHFDPRVVRAALDMGALGRDAEE